MDRHLKTPVAGVIKQDFPIESANYVELLSAFLHFTNHLNHTVFQIADCNCGPTFTIKSHVIYWDTCSTSLCLEPYRISKRDKLPVK